MIFFLFLITASLAQVLDDGFTVQQWRKCQDTIYERPNIFHVTGKAIYSAKPTIGVLQFGVDKINMNAANALQDCMNATQKAIISIQSLSSDNQLTLTTSQLSIQPSYEYLYDSSTGTNKQKFRGYQAKNTLTVRTKEVEKIGLMIDESIKAGMNRVDRINFDFDQTVKKLSEDELLVMAIKNAKERALKTLDPLNMEIVGIKSIALKSEQTPMFSASYGSNSTAIGSGRSAPTQVFAGQQDMDYSVTVGYIIRQKTKNQ